MEELKGISPEIVEQVSAKVESIKLTNEFKLVKAEIKSYSVFAAFKYRDKVDSSKNIDIEFEIPKHYAQASTSIDTVKNIEAICRELNLQHGYIIEELNVKKKVIISTFKSYNDYTVVKVRIPRDYF